MEDYDAGWRVLGVENGKVLLVTEELIQPGDSSFCLTGPIAYKNLETELNEIANLYGQGKFASSARSIKLDDINILANFDLETYIDDEEDNIRLYGNEVTYYWNGSEAPCYTSSNGTSGDATTYPHSEFYWFDYDKNEWEYKENSTTASEEKKEKIVTLKNNEFYYYPEYLKTDIYNLLFIDTNDSSNYLTYFLPTRIQVAATSGSSQGVIMYEAYSEACVRYGGVCNGMYHGLFRSYGRWDTEYAGVRVCVTINSNVKLDYESGKYVLSEKID